MNVAIQTMALPPASVYKHATLGSARSSGDFPPGLPDAQSIEIAG